MANVIAGPVAVPPAIIVPVATIEVGSPKLEVVIELTRPFASAK